MINVKQVHSDWHILTAAQGATCSENLVISLTCTRALRRALLSNLAKRQPHALTADALRCSCAVQLENVFKKIQKNCSLLVDASAADERAGASLEVMEVIFSAEMAFDIMNRFGPPHCAATVVRPERGRRAAAH